MRSFVAAIIVEAAEARLRASVALLGKSTQPMLTLSHHNLDFGVCDMYDRRDVVSIGVVPLTRCELYV